MVVEVLVRGFLAATTLAVAALAGGSAAQAATVISAKSVTVNIGGEAGMPWAAANMINQTGLDKTYVSGVTDWDTYIASNPIHNMGAYSEWASLSGTTSARVTFDFGEEVTIGQLAFWDEDSSSNSSVALSTPELGAFYTFRPVESVPGTFTGAQVFGFRPITTRYLTFDFAGCNAGGRYSHTGCGLREVAFATAAVSAVPEPATWAMMIVGLGGVGAVLRSRRRAGPSLA